MNNNNRENNKHNLERIIRYKSYAFACLLLFVGVLGLITYASIYFEVFLPEVFVMRLSTLVIVVTMYFLLIRVLDSYKKYVLK